MEKNKFINKYKKYSTISRNTTKMKILNYTIKKQCNEFQNWILRYYEVEISLQFNSRNSYVLPANDQ